MMWIIFIVLLTNSRKILIWLVQSVAWFSFVFPAVPSTVLVNVVQCVDPTWHIDTGQVSLGSHATETDLSHLGDLERIEQFSKPKVYLFYVAWRQLLRRSSGIIDAWLTSCWIELAPVPFISLIMCFYKSIQFKPWCASANSYAGWDARAERTQSCHGTPFPAMLCDKGQRPPTKLPCLHTL